MPSLKHIHKLQRIPPKSQFAGQWKCGDPYCSYRAALEDVRDKATCCNKCEVEMILNAKARTMAKPLCLKCRYPDVVKEIKVEDIEQMTVIDSQLAKLGLLD